MSFENSDDFIGGVAAPVGKNLQTGSFDVEARYNLDTLLNIFDYSGAKMMLDPSPTVYNNEILTSKNNIIYYKISNIT